MGQEDAEVAFILNELGICVQTAGSLEETEVFLQRCLLDQGRQSWAERIWH